MSHRARSTDVCDLSAARAVGEASHPESERASCYKTSGVGECEGIAEKAGLARRRTPSDRRPQLGSLPGRRDHSSHTVHAGPACIGEEPLPQRVDYMVELGIFKGGSIAFFEAWYSPSLLVGLDIRSERVAALDTYLERRSASERVKLYYDTDQRDRDALQRIAQENFEGRFLDVVIDDGAHRYQASKTSLNVFLPLVRPGGLYVIEDWAWAHWPGISHQENAASGDYADQVHPLTKLVFEAVMVAASRPDVISDVWTDGSRAFLRRGASDVDHADFNLSRAYLTSLWAMEFELSPGVARDRDCQEPTRLLKLWRDWVPPSIRTRVPPSLASFAHRWTSSPRRIRGHSTIEAPFGGDPPPE
jgi:hypothetical protein